MSQRLAIILIAIIAACLLAFSGIWQSDDVRIWVFDVGQGDAIFIDGPEKQILIDGGPDAVALERLSSVMPWWDRKIDILVNTHPHADHYVGFLPILERYKVDDVFDPGAGYSTAEFAEYLKLAGSRRRPISAGEVIDLGDGATLTVLWPTEPYNGASLEDPNDASVILLFEYGEITMLLTGDAGIDQEQAIVDGTHLGDIDILKVGHHGSDTSTSQDFLDNIKPEIAIISSGEGNEYGHPSSFVVDRLERSGATVYRTDTHGSIGIFTDGELMKVVQKVF